ncbi:hypothetical protein NVIRENTERO_00785 [Sodalis praecaptivus]|nr:hypothetical protein NVIRENTERO_00785 [Sodalis praecaptivus]
MNDLEITQAVSRVLSKYTKSAPQTQAHPPCFVDCARPRQH